MAKKENQAVGRNIKPPRLFRGYMQLEKQQREGICFAYHSPWKKYHLTLKTLLLEVGSMMIFDRVKNNAETVLTLCEGNSCVVVQYVG